MGNLYKLEIIRVYCVECYRHNGHKTTHALMPSFIIPHHQYLIEDIIKMIVVNSKDEAEILMNENPFICPALILHTKQVYKANWLPYINYSSLIINDHNNDTNISLYCIYNQGRNFMQMRKTYNHIAKFS